MTVLCEASSKFNRRSSQNTNVHTPRIMRGAIPRAQNLFFATVSRNRTTESYERVHPAKSKCASRYNAIQNFKMRISLQQRAQKCMKPAHDVRGMEKLPFYHNFECPTSTKWREGCAGQLKFCISSLQFWASDEHEVTRGLRRRSGKFAFHHSFRFPRSTKWRDGCRAAILSSSSQQQPFSAALLSHHLAVVRGLVVSYYSSCCCGQGLVVSYLMIILLWSGVASHRTVVILLWSGVGGQFLFIMLLWSHVGGQFLFIMLLWSGVGGQLFDHCLSVVRGWWSSYCRQELVDLTAVRSWWSTAENFTIEKNTQNNHKLNKNNEN